MKTIKFRAKTCKDDKWVYGSYLESNESWHGCKPHKSWIVGRVYSNGGWFSIVGRYPVKDNTVGQFTGLTDINGKEIYEGDIIQDEYKHRHLVRYSNDGACFTATLVEYMYDTFAEKWNTGRVYQDWINEFEKVVIGNIHDNPELMKGGEK